MMRSVLKWVGGKQGIIQPLKGVLPSGSRLIEPFGGSGVVMMNTDYPGYILADINTDLISLYEVIRETPERVICELRDLYRVGNSSDAYYELRAEFNRRDESNRERRAALFLYLNRHCWQGVCRYNKRKGEFNTPWGNYKRPYFPETEIHLMSERLANVELLCAGFEETLSLAKSGDVVYCDPPYVNKGKFTGYHSSGFGSIEQQRLVDLIRELPGRGVHVVASSHDAADIRQIYHGFEIVPVSAPRSVFAGKGDGKKVNEIFAVLATSTIYQEGA